MAGKLNKDAVYRAAKKDTKDYLITHDLQPLHNPTAGCCPNKYEVQQ